MSEIQEYKCPCCGGAITFDSKLQKMKCPYCDTEFDVETLKAYDDDLKKEGADELKWASDTASEWQEGETDGMRIYVCRSCGGEIIGDDTLAATSCPYCGNPVVFMGQFGGDLRPDCIIPFALDKESAKNAYRKHISGKKLLPKPFADENHIDEIKGVYVPFWLFGAEADGSARFRASRVTSWSDGKYRYTKTDHYSLLRSGKMSFADIPVDGSTKMPDELMESIEPYRMEEAVDFKTAYLAGYIADRYDVPSEDCVSRANERIKRSVCEALSGTLGGYTGITTESESVRLSGGKSRYALCPVWILNTTWQGKKYIFAMNGQTGKMVGDLPLDTSAYRRWLFGIAGAVSAVVFLLSWLMWLF
ncbi:MAG: hypothetical protein ACI4QZ_03680 [Eubacteriales bacterium]